jgi:hypothetical protein
MRDTREQFKHSETVSAAAAAKPPGLTWPWRHDRARPGTITSAAPNWDTPYAKSTFGRRRCFCDVLAQAELNACFPCDLQLELSRMPTLSMPSSNLDGFGPP